MKRCMIFAGGPLSDCDRVEPGAADFVIACDAGYLTAKHFGIVPNLVVGDFDSFCGTVEPGPEVYTAPAHKDDTDTMLGVKLGLERGYRDFLLVGGFGGRLDHTVANLQTLCYLCGQGAAGEIRANANRAWAVRDGALRLPRMEGWHLSVFAASGVCRGVTLTGLAYPLQNATITPSFPIGVSNEFESAFGEVAVEHGTLLVIASKEGRS